MIQDKIFFDEKDPTGLSYNTPFTFYGSYQGRLWSKAPGGEIKYYTQNSDLSVYATTGSNQFNGNQTITGSLTVTGGIIGTAATSSYVEYSNVANKPTLVSGSAQIADFGIFATTGSNGFNGSQSITGSLTVTGQVVAQTLNVQQVTSSIVYSSGSNIFGNNSGNTHQFTGSLNVNGQGTFYQPLTNSTAYLTIQNNRARNAAVYTQTTNGGFYAGTSIGTDTFNYQIYDGVAGTARLTIASTGAATFNTTATTSVSAISTGTASGLQLTNSGGTASSWIIQSDGGAVAGQAALRFYSLTASAYRMSIDGSGNVGIGTTSPAYQLTLNKASNPQIAFTTGDVLKAAITHITSDNSLRIYNIDGDKITITSGGNVLIGTSDNNGAKLQVGGDATLSGTLNINGSYIRGKTITGTANGTDVIFGVFLGFPGAISGTVQVFAAAGIIGGGNLSTRVLTFNFSGANNSGGGGASSNVNSSVLGTQASADTNYTNITSLSASITSASTSAFNISISNTITGLQITAPTYYIQVTYGLHGNASIS